MATYRAYRLAVGIELNPCTRLSRGSRPSLVLVRSTRGPVETMRDIKQNLFFALVYVPIAAMSLSSVSVGNSLRLRTVRL